MAEREEEGITWHDILRQTEEVYDEVQDKPESVFESKHFGQVRKLCKMIWAWKESSGDPQKEEPPAIEFAKASGYRDGLLSATRRGPDNSAVGLPPSLLQKGDGSPAMKAQIEAAYIRAWADGHNEGVKTWALTRETSNG